jgi:riboflavin transporter FmnP
LWALIPILIVVFAIGLQAGFFFKYMDGSVQHLVEHVNAVVAAAGQ